MHNAIGPRMTITKIIISLTFFTILISSSYGQKDIKIPAKFVETIPPKVSTDKWFSLNHSKNEFLVENVNGKLHVKKIKRLYKCELKVSNGSLIGIDNGEWGGQLIFTSANKTNDTTEIKRGNIKFIFYFKEQLYFIEGIAHGDISRGALYQLDTTNDKFTYKKLVDFEDAPEAFTIYQDKFLIATYENFYILKDFEKQLIFKDTFWDGLYPTSIAVFDDRNVFLGMRGGIVRLDLLTKTLKFYKNDK